MLELPLPGSLSFIIAAPFDDQVPSARFPLSRLRIATKKDKLTTQRNHGSANTSLGESVRSVPIQIVWAISPP
jgi:hypothetical protein